MLEAGGVLGPRWLSKPRLFLGREGSGGGVGLALSPIRLAVPKPQEWEEVGEGPVLPKPGDTKSMQVQWNPVNPGTWAEPQSLPRLLP